MAKVLKSDDREYSLKQIDCGKQMSFEHNNNTPLVVPADCRQPETYNEAIARILHHSGVIDDGAYQKLRGIEFDGDYDDDADFDSDGWDDDDEFDQSSFASYEDAVLAYNSHESRKTSDSEQPQSQSGSPRSQPVASDSESESAATESDSE